MLTGEQIRAARAILRMEQTALATEAGVSVETIKRLERLDGPLNAQFETLSAIRQVFERAGLDLQGDGVRRAALRHAFLIANIAGQVQRVARVGLEREAKRDPKLFERDIQHVTDKLARYLERRFLEGIVRRAMPKERGGRI
jgi:transcriptional regulator with XRE-family HTH domain